MRATAPSPAPTPGSPVTRKLKPSRPPPKKKKKKKKKLPIAGSKVRKPLLQFWVRTSSSVKDVWPGRWRRIALVATMTDSVIVRLEKVSIVRVIHQEPAFSEMFIAHLVGRGIRVEQTLSISCSIRARNVLPGCSCCWRTLARRGRPEPIIAKISQETLAEMIVITGSGVSFLHEQISKLGFIHYNGDGVEVHSSLLNVVLDDEPHIETEQIET